VKQANAKGRRAEKGWTATLVQLGGEDEDEDADEDEHEAVQCSALSGDDVRAW
jgi:hypothetical protein